MKAPDAGIVSWGLKGEAWQRRTAGDTRRDGDQRRWRVRERGRQMGTLAMSDL